jgi:rare lipoprotein A
MRSVRGVASIQAAIVVALGLLLAACGGSPRRDYPAPPAGVPAPAPTAADVVSEPRSPRGNPPFYEVFGRRYHVLDTSEGYRERGVASWYGPDFHGLTTSNGETYDMYAYTAAHPTLPIPTWVEVTHLGNGKRVIVRINDRGPFVGNRIIDLSYRAAHAIDMVGDGTAMVEVRTLGAPAAAPQAVQARSRGGLSVISEAAAAAPSASDRPLRQMFVQVGAFSDRDNAQQFVNQLQANGFQNTVVVSNPVNGATMHRVRVGPVSGEDEFDRVNQRLRAIGINDTHLVVDR